MSTRSDGLEKVVFDNDFFTQNFSSNTPFSEQEIRATFEDSYKNIWVGAKNGKIYVYDSDKKFKGILCDNGEVKPNGNPIKGMAYTIVKDGENNIWVGTKGEGLYLLKPHGNSKNLKYNITNFRYDKKNSYSVSSNNIYNIHEDDNGKIWIGTYGGGLNLFDNDKFINYRNELRNYPYNMGYQVRFVSSDRNGCILVGTTLGLIAFFPNYSTPSATVFKTFSNNPQEKSGISANDIFSIYRASNGDIYLATYGGGLCKIAEKDEDGYPLKFKSYRPSDGLPSDVILSIVEDNDGKLWISSEGNLSEFDPYGESFKTFNDVSRIMEKQFFSEAQAIKTHSGEIIFGRREGTLSFFPENIFIDDFRPYLALTKFRIFNKNFPLSGNIDDISEINLTYKENSFSIEYIALDYSNPQNIIYSYRLDGFDNDWIPNQKQQIASYTNIAPGNYIFKVRSTNSNGNWVNNEHSIRINISPVFWQTGKAYAIYALALLLILFTTFRIIFVFYRMRNKIRIEQEQTEMKTRFFTDISHEIRTPLTMIVSPVENILEKEDTPEDVKSQLNLVLKNSNRMLNMVNQILDFRKIQKREFSIEEVSIGKFISEICNNHFLLTEEQKIKFIVNNEVGSDKIWMDKEAVEKLVFNLISNAIKYTKPGNTVEVNILRRDKTIALQVKDDGRGMSKDTISKLFTRFTSFNLDKSKPSTGIGLSIVKEVADKHHAKILVKSDVDKGSSFIVLFHKGIEHFTKDPNVILIKPEFNETPKESNDTILNEVDKPSGINEIPSILIVEDDTDLRTFIKSVLSNYYKTYEADNGKEGYDSAFQNLPDFIISDIMMPDMDGVEFLQKIRSNPMTSHIPFILLTAKSSINDKLEGIEYGADDYITKPFNVKLLRAKIRNIFEQRKRIFNYYSDNTTAAKKSSSEDRKKHQITLQDETFIKKITEEIEKNIDNSEFFVDDLVAATNFSRKVFFKKLKSLTGLAPVEFIREVRIKYAANLLATEEYSVKEISYMAGFSDIKYFTKCFKKTYDMTPLQYRNEAKY
jgi:signal transduction histidine kinase/DNA-binding response OmpR family regulator